MVAVAVIIVIVIIIITNYNTGSSGIDDGDNSSIDDIENLGIRFLIPANTNDTSFQ